MHNTNYSKGNLYIYRDAIRNGKFNGEYLRSIRKIGHSKNIHQREGGLKMLGNCGFECVLEVIEDKYSVRKIDDMLKNSGDFYNYPYPRIKDKNRTEYYYNVDNGKLLCDWLDYFGIKYRNVTTDVINGTYELPDGDNYITDPNYDSN
jgi:hypothetical protein